MKTITIIGNLGSNAIVRTAADGKQLMSFNVAVNQGKDASPVWFNCIGNLREKIIPYLIKGQSVCVMGDLRAGVYNGNIDLSISIDKCELCGAAPDNNSDKNNTQQ